MAPVRWYSAILPAIDLPTPGILSSAASLIPVTSPA
jgi:hypothetical protein